MPTVPRVSTLVPFIRMALIDCYTCTFSPQITRTTPLFLVIEYGDPDLVRVLLDSGADPDRSDMVRIAKHC